MTPRSIAERLVPYTQRQPHYADVLPSRVTFPTVSPVFGEDLFRSVLVRERKRADRSNQPLLLALITLLAVREAEAAAIWPAVVDAMDAAKRDTDVLGWFDDLLTLGLILPEAESPAALARDLDDRIRRELFRRLDAQTASRVSIQVHIHPDPGSVENPIVDRPFAAGKRRSRYDVAKRAIDFVASLALLALLSPLFLVIAALVKLTSPGPVFFRQERVGQMMKPFMMLKFRTMRVNTDHAIHYEFVSSFIKSGNRVASAGKSGLFKIVNDPRVTSIGRLLRRTSLDELPQLWNVLRGDMSLVGPRPPLAYEVAQYQSWHRRRVLEAKPGVTGLWQVTGRSRTTFDEMVRLDIRYARTYSAWTDIKILLATPRAVFSGKGAC
jgi:lipopolysaccharide/colanic/teichoic acid biosynthesis glycosyltransferase